MKQEAKLGAWLPCCRVIAFLCLLVPLSTSTQAQAIHATAVVATASGPVQGVIVGNTDEFLGIPYAAPPVGPLRWKPPQEPAAWSQTFAAAKFGNICPQVDRGVFATPSTTEDCLYLNVFAPKAGSSAKKRAVMVWFHGGGLFSGESDDYDGRKLAERGDVVVVTLNYRIAAFGFFSHPAINGEGHDFANYGLMDQQLALKWVQRNIAAFGGDPDRVTIFGQSGGGHAVIYQLASPTAAGLFQRAIVESGTDLHAYDPDTALKDAAIFAKDAGCTDQSAACLRALSVQQILDHQQVIVNHFVNSFPVADGKIITGSGYRAFESGQFNKVPILNGVTEDEQAFFLPESRFNNPPLTEDEYRQYLAGFGPENAARLIAKYPLSSYASASLAEITAGSDLRACGTRLMDRVWSAHAPVFAYEFDDRTAPSYFPTYSYPMRAYHTAELEYLFPMFHGGRGAPHALNPSQHKLSDQLVDYWTNFAKTGTPNAPEKTAAAWPAYAPSEDDVLSLNVPRNKSERDYGTLRNCASWDPLIPTNW